MAKIKILFIDDEPDFLEVISDQIKSWGFDVIKAENGAEGIKAMESHCPDIIILDYAMSEMSGIAVLREIRKKDKNIPVIMHTAHPDEVLIRAAGELTIDAFIPKLSVYEDTQTMLKTALEIAAKKIGRK